MFLHNIGEDPNLSRGLGTPNPIMLPSCLQPSAAPKLPLTHNSHNSTRPLTRDDCSGRPPIRDVPQYLLIIIYHRPRQCILCLSTLARDPRADSLPGARHLPVTGGSGTARADPHEGDEHTRDIAREEIGRMVAGVMDSLAGLVRRGEMGGT